MPSDPATYTFRAVTPAGSTFVANGELTGKQTHRGRTLWTYEEREPMAAELIQLAFGALTVERGLRAGRAPARRWPPTRSARSSRRSSAPATTWTA